MLAPRENASILLGQSVEFLKQNTDATWSGTISYLNAPGDSRSMPFSVTGEHERMALLHDQEAPKTHYKLQQLPDALEKIGSELEMLRHVVADTTARVRIDEPVTSVE